MQALFGSAFGPAATIDVRFTNVEGRLLKHLDVPEASVGGAGTSGVPVSNYYIYSNGEDVSGEAVVAIPGGRKLEHVGVKVELKGVVDLDGRTSSEFCALVKELSGPGVISGLQTFKWSFPKVEMPHESYEGLNARCRYFIRVTVSRAGYAVSNVVKEQDFLVQNVEAPPATDSSLKLEVGIEECLHIEFEYDRSRYHLTDIVTGRVNFLLVRIRIKYMEVAVIRRESAGPAGAVHTESETLTRFEVMDGCPVRGEKIPIRLHFSGIPDLTPSYSSVGGAFSVRYFLNLVLVDEEDRRYFKQQEVVLWRRELKA